MDQNQQYTPQKFLKKQPFNLSSPAAFKFLSQQQNSRILVTTTPQNKFLRSSITNTSGSIKKRTSSNNSTTNNSTAFHIFPILNTPPSRTKFIKVLNPFEAALTDRLHLPLICSPSLFQRPATPQHSSTQFEWTIEDVSSLGPANVEPHETQFLGDSFDPDIEAKAQAAISSYFKDQQIVPSPQNSSLRNQRPILSENCNNSLMQSPIIKPPKRIRDSYTQTILTLPPTLPLELENMLKPYFKYHENQQQIVNCDNKSNNMSIDYEARDVSLRRKLFDIPICNNNGGDNTSDDDDGLIICNEFSPPPKTPDMETPMLSMNHSNESLDKSSFGALSPISKLISPKKSSKQYPCSSQEYLQDSSILEKISPIKSTSRTIQLKKGSPIVFIKKSSSPLKNIPTISSDINERKENIDLNQINHKLERNNSSPDLNRMSVDANSSLIKNIIVNKFFDSNAIIVHKLDENSQQKSKSLTEVDIFNQSGNYFDDDVMQVSQLSTKSTTSSTSSINDTPRRRRSIGRKNLSQSFSCNFSDTEEDESNIDLETGKQIDIPDENKPLVKRRSSPNNNHDNLIFSSIIRTDNIKRNTIGNNINETLNSKTNFYRTDSGFNENTQDEFIQYQKNVDCNKENITNYDNLKNNFDEIKSCNNDVSLNQDVSMICCSTPSKRMEFL